MRSIEQFKSLSDDELRAKTADVESRSSPRSRIPEELARRLDEILPEAFAVVKNAARRLNGAAR